MSPDSIIKNNPQESLAVAPSAEKIPLPIEPETQEKKEGKEALTENEKARLRAEILWEVEKSDAPLAKQPMIVAPALKPTPLAKSQNLVQIERILEDDLQDVYFKLEPAIQKKFKTQGEQMALQIEQILNSAKVRAKNIFNLILDWLKIIPGVNKFFIRQEAKIKTEKIMQLKDNE